MFSGIVTEIGFLRPVKFLSTPSSSGKKQVRVRVSGALKIFLSTRLVIVFLLTVFV